MTQGTKDGIILVNKPRGITSHDVVDVARKKLGIKKIGHAGTLDPMAEGLLILLVGNSTRLFAKFVHFDKEYAGVMKLGEVTSTGDSQGDILAKKDYSGITTERLKEVFNSFLGEIEQVPPMVSALRVKGKRLYELARKGITVERAARKIKIYALEILKIEFPLVEFYVRCSKGTYVRQIAFDAGQLLGCGAHMINIKRLSVGPFKLDEAVAPDGINESCLRKAAF